MKTLMRPANERGVTQTDWLHSAHTFSFGRYVDREWMGYRSLRVINDDLVQPGTGFGLHPHDNMEILSVILSGEITHQDTLGNKQVLRAGGVQMMTAGSGLMHAEFNEGSEVLHLLQIWIHPARRDLTPSYAEAYLSGTETQEIIADGFGNQGLLPINQRARISMLNLAAGTSKQIEVDPGHGIWLQAIQGTLELGDQTLKPGDGLAIEEAKSLSISASAEGVKALLFELA